MKKIITTIISWSTPLCDKNILLLMCNKKSLLLTGGMNFMIFGWKKCYSPSPTTVSTTKPIDDKVDNEKEAQASVSVDQSTPTTSVQIRLADGSRIVATLNQTHTIADLRRYIILYPFNTRCFKS